jgi:magnesium transporter
VTNDPEHLRRPVTSVARKDFTTLRDDLTVQQALELIRVQGLGEQIFYFYVVDANARLLGVLPTRRLLTSPLHVKLGDIMLRQVVTIPAAATLMEACEAFVLHKFLAFPVVDADHKILGVVDVSFFTEEVFELADEQARDDPFEALGFHIDQVRDASPLRAFRFRFPWLVATIGSGTICALLASAYEVTLAKTIVLAFFLTLVLGLGESVSIQSMTVTIQALRSVRPTFAWYIRALRRELGTSFLLGIGCGLLVGLIVWAWRGHAMAGLSIGLSIFLTVCASCFFGLSVPALLHALRLDPKIAAGPVTLACTDVCTLLFYFTVAAHLL